MFCEWKIFYSSCLFLHISYSKKGKKCDKQLEIPHIHCMIRFSIPDHNAWNFVFKFFLNGTGSVYYNYNISAPMQTFREWPHLYSKIAFRLNLHF